MAPLNVSKTVTISKTVWTVGSAQYGTAPGFNAMVSYSSKSTKCKVFCHAVDCVDTCCPTCTCSCQFQPYTDVIPSTVCILPPYPDPPAA